MTHPHASLGVAPAKLLYGHTVELDRGVFPESTSVMANKNTPTFTQEFWQDMLAAQQHLVEKAKAWQQALDSEHIASRTGTHTVVGQFAPGTYVLVAYPEVDGQKPPHKLATRKRGPLRVIEQVGNTVHLQDLAHDHVEEVHVTRVQKFEFDPDHTDPYMVAIADTQEFLVEAIQGHSFAYPEEDQSRPRQLFLEVKWQGMDSTTLEPVSTLTHMPLARAYLQANKLARYIPRNLRGNLEALPRPRQKRKRTTTENRSSTRRPRKTPRAN